MDGATESECRPAPRAPAAPPRRTRRRSRHAGSSSAARRRRCCRSTSRRDCAGRRRTPSWARASTRCGTTAQSRGPGADGVREPGRASRGRGRRCAWGAGRGPLVGPFGGRKTARPGARPDRYPHPYPRPGARPASAPPRPQAWTQGRRVGGWGWRRGQGRARRTHPRPRSRPSRAAPTRGRSRIYIRRPPPPAEGEPRLNTPLLSAAAPPTRADRVGPASVSRRGSRRNPREGESRRTAPLPQARVKCLLRELRRIPPALRGFQCRRLYADLRHTPEGRDRDGSLEGLRPVLPENDPGTLLPQDLGLRPCTLWGEGGGGRGEGARPGPDAPSRDGPRRVEPKSSGRTRLRKGRAGRAPTGRHKPSSLWAAPSKVRHPHPPHRQKWRPSNLYPSSSFVGSTGAEEVVLAPARAAGIARSGPTAETPDPWGRRGDWARETGVATRSGTRRATTTARTTAGATTRTR